MISPGWLADVLAAVVIAVALFSAARLAAARGRRRRCEVDADGVHVMMGIAMAGMFVPQLATLPGPVWAAVFAAGAGWFGWRAVRVRRLAAGGQPSGAAGPPGAGSALSRAGLGRDCCPYPVPHLIDCLAMVYALLAVPAIGAASRPAGGGMVAGLSGMAGGGARFPVIGLVLALFVCGYVVWLADRIQRFAAGAGGRQAVPARAGLPALAGATAVRGAGASRPGRARTPGDPGLASPAPGAPAGLSQASAVPGTPGDPGLASPAPVAAAGGAADAHAGHVAALLAPRAATCCKIAMGVAMGVMLIDLL